jgi:hypothetical protein
MIQIQVIQLNISLTYDNVDETAESEDGTDIDMAVDS